MKKNRYEIFSLLIWAISMIFSACTFEENTRDQVLKSQNRLTINSQLRIESQNVSILSFEAIKGKTPKMILRPSGLDFSLKVFSKSCHPIALDFELQHYHRIPTQLHEWQYGFSALPLEQGFLNNLSPMISFKSSQVRDDFYPIFDSREIFIEPDCIGSSILDVNCFNAQSNAWRLYLERQPYFAYTYAKSEFEETDSNVNMNEILNVNTSQEVACTQFSNIEAVVEHRFENTNVNRWIVLNNLIDLDSANREKLLAKLSSLSPDFLILNGDSYLDEIFEHVDSIGIPWFSVIGDRDLADVDDYLKAIGTNAMYIDIDQIRIVLIDTADQEISNTQYTFLEKAISSNQAKTKLPPQIKLVFSHIPPMSKHDSDLQFHYRPDAARVIELCNQKNVDLWFTSHNLRDEAQDMYHQSHRFRKIQHGIAKQITLFEKTTECQTSQDWEILAITQEKICVRYQKIELD